MTKLDGLWYRLGMRQTSANNDFLRGVKIAMNKKIYARVCKLVNTPGGSLSGGMTQAVVYLQQFYNHPISAKDFEAYQFTMAGVDLNR